MKTSLALIIIGLLSANVMAQTNVSGTVTDAAGNRLMQANVLLEGSYDGQSTDSAGYFEFTTAEAGDRALIVTFTGFKAFSKNIHLSGVPLHFNIALNEEVRSLETVTISAGTFTAADQARRSIFRAVDIATTAGATADIAGALNTLPGTHKVGESGRLFVRGGDGHEAGTFIDGMMVLEPYTASAPGAPGRGRFLPFMFKGMSFSTGGYSAEYGQALSSTLILESKDKAEITRTDLGILSVGADVGHTHTWDRGSAAAKIHYTDIRPYYRLISPGIDWIQAPVSLDGHAAFRQQSGKHGMLKVYGNYNHSDFSLYNHSIDHDSQKTRYDLTNNYKHLNASYKNILNENWIFRSGISYSDIRNTTADGDELIEHEEHGVHVKTVFEGSIADDAELKTGLEIIGRTNREKINHSPLASFTELIPSAFMETDIYHGKNFVSRGGLRLEYNSLINRFSVDPRISLAYRAGARGQISLAYGKFRQSPKNEFLATDRLLQSEKAVHYIASYQHVENNRTFRIESYYKRYSDLVKFGHANKRHLTNSGYGFARGIEIFWRDHSSLKNADYWVSYSFLKTERNYLDFPISATPAFASTHNFSAVYKHFIPRLKSQPGATFSYASGRRYNNPNSGIFNGSTTPSYRDLSVNWSYLPHPVLIVYVSCTNVFGRDNIFGYEYGSQPNEQGLYNGRAIRQPAKHFLFVGIFITLSKEKSINQLPNL
jgi:hypothetical protein